MAFLETVRCWNEGVVAFQEDRCKDSLLSFNSILEPSARIQFNIACVLKSLSRENDCIVHLGEAIKKDPHLAVAFYHRAVQYLKLKKYNEALDDLDRAEQSLRGSSFIKYSQLGLNFTLYKFEIQFNRAVCFARQGDIRTAVHMLIDAGKIAEEEVHSRISVKTIQDLTLVKQEGYKGNLPSSFNEFEVPGECLFQPPKDMVANLGRKEYVAKSKVIKGSVRGQSKSTSNTETGEKPNYRSLAPRTPPLPRRPLPPQPSELRTSRSMGSIVEELKKEEASSQSWQFSKNNELTNALNAQFKNKNMPSKPPSKPPHTPTRPPRRPPPPGSTSCPRNISPSTNSNFDSPPLPVKATTKTLPSQNLSSPPARSGSNGTTRNIPPPPSYKPPPPPPSFRAPPPPLKQNNLPPLPPKKRT
ncbi:neutrophil cytosol factor 2-like isoform X2 [Mytilus trossulus]|uniref:neutrophil cytosol factor 2-like isoform X2 n=1 Tax=Mytilus trossulus TaxID=6551 RepID=UPI0030064F0E